MKDENNVNVITTAFITIMITIILGAITILFIVGIQNNENTSSVITDIPVSEDSLMLLNSKSLLYTPSNLQVSTPNQTWLDFDGVNDFISVNKNISIVAFNKSFGLIMFTKLKSNISGQTFISKYSSTPKGWIYRLSNFNATEFIIYNSSGNGQAFYGTGLDGLYDKWIEHGYCQNSSGYNTMYINGKSIQDGQINNTANGVGIDINLTIGSRNSNYFNGSIGEILIFDDCPYEFTDMKRIINDSKYGTNLGLSIPIIYYHNVGNGLSLSMNTSNFSAQMNYLYNNGFKTVSMQNIYDWKNNNFIMPEKPINIQFDDGLYGVYINALPILKSYNFTATLLIPGNDTIYGTPGITVMSWENITDWINQGNEIGSHGLSNWTGAYNYSLSQRIEEMNNSKWYIYNKTGIIPKYWVYPTNLRNSSTDDLCSQFYTMCSGDVTGYVWITSNLTHNGLKRLGLGSDLYVVEQNPSTGKQWSFSRRVSKYEGLILHLKFTENNGTLSYNKLNSSINNGYLNGATWQTDGQTRNLISGVDYDIDYKTVTTSSEWLYNFLTFDYTYKENEENRTTRYNSFFNSIALTMSLLLLIVIIGIVLYATIRSITDAIQK